MPNPKYQPVIKRNRRKNKTNRHVMPVYPSPYQSKDAKLKEIKKTYGLSYKNMFEPGQAAINFSSTVRPNQKHRPKVESIGGGSKPTQTKQAQVSIADQIYLFVIINFIVIDC